MPTLPNLKHERFAQALADGKSGAQAYIEAGYRANTGNAATLKAHESVLKRVTEILAEREESHKQATAQAIAATGLTKEWVIAKLTENAENAADAGDFGPSNKALELLGKELGMFVDSLKVRSDVAVTHKSDDLSATSRWLDEFAGSGETPALPSALPN